MVGEHKKALVKNIWTPSKGYAQGKGEPKTVRAEQHWLNDLQVIEHLTRDKDILLQPMRPNLIALYQYGLVDASKGVFVSGLSTLKNVSGGMSDGSVRVHDRNGVWCEEH